MRVLASLAALLLAACSGEQTPADEAVVKEVQPEQTARFATYNTYLNRPAAG
ncbi:hypothetical protein MNBD_ALPHA05-1976, partial [hydrothermal vent metagenome]